MRVKKMKNGVRIAYGFNKGYGGLDSHSAKFFYKNRTLAELATPNCCALAVWAYKKRRKYRKLSEGQLLELTKNAPQAFQVCDQCRRALVAGAVLQGGLQRCRRCSDRTHYSEVGPAVTARAQARANTKTQSNG